MSKDDHLDDWFAAARAAEPVPRAAYLSALSAAARAEARQLGQPAERPAKPWALLQSALGGWPGLAGLTAAVAFGLMLGVLPSLAPSLADGWLGRSEAWLVDPLPGLDSQLSLALSES